MILVLDNVYFNQSVVNKDKAGLFKNSTLPTIISAIISLKRLSKISIAIGLFYIRVIQGKFPVRIKDEKLLLRNNFENCSRKMLSGKKKKKTLK